MARQLKKVTDIKNRKAASGASPYYDGAQFTLTNIPSGYENDRKEVYIVYEANVDGGEFWLQMLRKARKSTDGRSINPQQTTDPSLAQLREFCKHAGSTTDSQMAAFEAAFGLPSNWASANCEVLRVVDNDAEFISIKVLNYVPATPPAPAAAAPAAPVAPVAPVAPTA